MPPYCGPSPGLLLQTQVQVNNNSDDDILEEDGSTLAPSAVDSSMGWLEIGGYHTYVHRTRRTRRLTHSKISHHFNGLISAA
ncbi:hypothetical protein SERLA73DRAFT_68417 [Serpula lacrymans var. lacrymans S7.3]|uniref:Uncharacterized protein n=2 Tax=Serpula lacrymans var. lacrymans TaxID=341189 RepID=F8PFH9_SERL3|nr:uncharacterized protein SERLADRAFT_432168 [Serpula lacrymans var. lacrymans S7.9]EGO04748.1 hypothetical protein SERLA73DRAFT_68417 [Serpula lacrymans var. lacrymans S7.3]EGO30596.1 hypothetical protein SERLADRAFT_432168 [Serpula lacrymans var. lacrymans S7.9]